MNSDIVHISRDLFHFHKNKGKKLIYSIVVPGVLFDLGIIQESSAFPALYEDYYRLPIATSIDHWAPLILFVDLINLPPWCFSMHRKKSNSV